MTHTMTIQAMEELLFDLTNPDESEREKARREEIARTEQKTAATKEKNLELEARIKVSKEALKARNQQRLAQIERDKQPTLSKKLAIKSR